MTSDKVFQSDSLFDYLPSYWKSSFGDRPVLETVYEALVRSMDVDWVRLFAANDTRELATTPVTTTHTLVHQPLGSWTSLEVAHGHYHTWLDWPAATGSPETYVIRLEDHVLTRPRLFFDGRAIPSFLYRLDTSHWSSGGSVVYGTTITFDKAQLDSFLDGSYLSLQGQSGENTSQEWTPADVIERLGILAYRDQRPFTGSGDASTTAFEFTIGGSAAVVEAFDAMAYVESIDVTSRVTVAAVTGGFSITPKPAGGFGAGMLLQATFDDDSQQLVELDSGTGSVTLRTSASSVTGVRLFVNIPLGEQHYTVTSSAVELLGGAVFPGGTILRVKDAKGIQSKTLTEPRSRVTFDRDIDTNSAQVLYQGTDVLATEVSTSGITFERPLNSGARWRVDAPVVVDHDHALYRTATDGTANIAIPTARPLTLAGSATDEDYPILLFVDGVLQDPSTYSPSSTVNLVLQSPLPSGIPVDVWYVDQEEPAEHLHSELSDVVPLSVPEQYSVSYSQAETFDDTTWPLTVFRDGFLENDPDQIRTVDGQFLQFTDALTPGIRVAADGLRTEFRYAHTIPHREDLDYGYRGDIQEIGTLQDGVMSPSSVKSPDTGFSLTPAASPAETATLKASITWDEAWLTGVKVDEHLLETTWGDPVGIKRPVSSTRYRNLLMAVYAAYRGPSFVDSLVNVSSILLGSAFLPTAGVSGGITRSSTGVQVLIEPTDPKESPYTVDLLPGEEHRILPAPREMSRLRAVNSLATVSDRSLDDIPWLAFMAQDVAEDYSYAKRLDVRSSSSFSSIPAGYDKTTGHLTDYSVNYNDQEVWVGDLIKLTLVASASPTSIIQTYTSDGTSPQQVQRLVYDSSQPTARLRAHVASPAVSTYKPGHYVNLEGAGSPWDTLTGEYYQLTNVSPGYAASTTRLTAEWISSHAAPTITAVDYTASPYPELQGYNLSQSTSTPDFQSYTQFTTVQEVLGDHTIRVSFDATSEVTGYGDETYGELGFGGGVLDPVPSAYTIWSRRTRQLDTYLSLDQALDESVALVPGETVQILNEELSALLSTHVFAMELAWDRMTDRETLEDLKVVIDRIRPAETRALVYTEGFPTLSLEMTGSLIGGSPDITETLADSLFLEESWMGTGSTALLTPELNYLYRPWQHRFGPRLESQLKEPPASPVVGGFYAVAPVGQASHLGVWASVYGSKGLEGQVLRRGSPDEWLVDSGFSPAPGWALDFSSGVRRLNSGPFTHNEGSPLTMRALVYVPSGSYSEAGTVYVGQASPMLPFGFEVQSPGLTLAPFFQVHSSETKALGSPTNYYDRWLDLVGVYREGAASYWYTDLYLDGTLIATSSPTGAASLTLAPSATFSLTLGGTTQSTPTQSPSFKGYLDEYRLYLGTELSSPEITTLYNAGSPVMPSIGVTDAGSPIAPAGITAWYVGQEHDPATVIDLSGNGYNASRQTATLGDENQDWRVAGYLQTRYRLFGDTYEIKLGGYYVDQGKLTTTLLGTPPSLLSDSPDSQTAAIDAGGQPLLIPGVFGFKDVVYTNQTRWLHYKDLEGWIITLANPQAPGSAISVDQEGNLGSQSPTTALASPLSITGSRLTLTCAAGSGGAVTQLELDGSPLLVNTLKGQLTQWSCRYLGRGFERTVSEAGKISRPVAQPSNSDFISKESGDTAIRTASYLGNIQGTMTYDGTLYDSSATRLDKLMEVGFNANPNVIRVDAIFDRDQSTKDGSWYSQFTMSLVPELNVAWLYQPGVDSVPLPAVFNGDVNYQTNWVGGAIYTNAAQDKAVGVFHRRPNTDTGWFQSQVLPAPASAVSKSSPGSTSYSVLNDQEFLGDYPGAADSIWRTERYIVSGTLTEVVGGFNQLAYELEGIEPIVTGPESATYIEFTSLPDPLTLGDTFSVTAQAFGPGGLIDPNFDRQAYLTLLTPGGTLTGTTTGTFASGEVTFSGLEVSPGGTWFLQVDSGGLAPGQAAIQVNNPAPYASNPTAWAISPAQVPLTLYGTDFLDTSFVVYSNWGGTPSPYPSTLTYVSPGEVQFTPPQEILDSYPNTLTLSVHNPGPGGGSTGELPLTIGSPGVPSPVVPSPVADLLLFTAPPSLPITPRVGENTLIGGYAADSTLSLALDVDATGAVTVSPSAQPAGSSIGGTLTQSLGASIPGYVFFPNLTFDTAGTYTLNLVHESPAVIAQTPLALNLSVLNPVPTLTSIDPDNIDQGAQTLTLRALGSNFVSGDSSIYWNGLQRTTTYVSPGELRTTLTAADFLVPQVVGVKVNTAQGGGDSSTIPFTINGAPGSGLTEEDLSPTIIVLSPSAYQRVLPTQGPVITTEEGVSLHRALEQTGLATAGTPIHAYDGSVGAIEVVEVRAGAYKAMATGDDVFKSDKNRNVAVPHAPDSDHPLIIRAAKWSAARAPEPDMVGDPEPYVLVARFPDFGSEDVIFHDRSLESSHWHWYDPILFLGSRGGMLIADNKIYGANDPTIPWLGWHMYRPKVLGRYDHRVYRLDSDRWIVGPGPDTASITQYDTTGVEISPKSWDLDDLHRARFGKRLTSSNGITSGFASLTSVPAGQITATHVGVFGNDADTLYRVGVASTAGGLIQTDLGLLSVFSSDAALTTSDFIASAPFDPITSPNQYASPPSLSYSMDVTWQSSSTFDAVPGAGGTIQFYDRKDDETLSPSTLLTAGGTVNVPLEQGIGAAFMAFTGRGCYVLKTTVKDEWGNPVPDPEDPDKDLTRNSIIQVTNHGMSDSPTSLEVVYDLPDQEMLWFSNITWAAGQNIGFMGPFSLLLEARTSSGALSMEVDGTVQVLIDSFETVEGTAIGTPFLSSNEITHIMRGGVCHIRDLHPYITSINPESFQAFLDQNSASNYAILTLTLTPFGTGTGLDSQSTTYQIGVWPPGAQRGESPGSIPVPFSVYPWGARLTDKEWLGPNLNEFALTLAPSDTIQGMESGAPVNAKVKTAIGLPFWAGWPGSPGHPNYRPGYENIWPKPEHTPGLEYIGYPTFDVQPKWGLAPFYTSDWIFDGGVIMNVGVEHGVYLHNTVGDTRFSNTIITRVGRTAIQKADRRIENPYDPVLVGTGGDTGGPGQGQVIYRNVQASETALNDGGGSYTIVGHGPDGQITMENCSIRQGFDDQLAAHRYISGNGMFGTMLTVWGGWFPGYSDHSFCLTGMGYQFDGLRRWHPFLRKADGSSVFTNDEYLTHLTNKYDVLGLSGVLGDYGGVPVPTPPHYTNLLYGAPMFSYGGVQDLGLTLGQEAAGIREPVFTGTDATYGMGSPTYASFHQTGTLTITGCLFEANHPNATSDAEVTWSQPLPSLNPYGSIYKGGTYSSAPALLVSDVRILTLQDNIIHQTGNQAIQFDEVAYVWDSPQAKATGKATKLITKNAAIWQILGGNNELISAAVVKRYGQDAPAELVSQLTSPST